MESYCLKKWNVETRDAEICGPKNYLRTKVISQRLIKKHLNISGHL